MTPSDWLYKIRNELQRVQNENEVFTIGIKEELEDSEVSVTITEQSDYLEAYIVAEPLHNSNIETAVRSVEEISSIIAVEDDSDKSTAKEKRNRWAEVRVRVDEESIKSL